MTHVTAIFQLQEKQTFNRNYLVPNHRHRRPFETGLSLGTASDVNSHSFQMSIGKRGYRLARGEVSRKTHELLREEIGNFGCSGCVVSNLYGFCKIGQSINNRVNKLSMNIQRNKPFGGESLMDNEPWVENGSMITIKEVKEEYPTVSLHLTGGQFKRKDLRLGNNINNYFSLLFLIIVFFAQRFHLSFFSIARS